MPLYEYECERCGHRFEVIQKFSDPLADVCPVCGGPVRKLMSSPAIQFKGSGFYITDYPKKDSSGGSRTDAGKSEKSDSGDKPAADTKSKTESSTDSKSSKDTKGAKDSKTKTSTDKST